MKLNLVISRTLKDLELCLVQVGDAIDKSIFFYLYFIDIGNIEYYLRRCPCISATDETKVHVRTCMYICLT